MQKGPAKRTPLVFFLPVELGRLRYKPQATASRCIGQQVKYAKNLRKNAKKTAPEGAASQQGEKLSTTPAKGP